MALRASADLDPEVADVVLTAKVNAGATIAELRERIPPENRHRVFLTGITRMDHALPVRPGTVVNTGDTVHMSGAKRDLASPMAYTIVYALSNVVLPLLGPVVVAMTGALV